AASPGRAASAAVMARGMAEPAAFSLYVQRRDGAAPLDLAVVGIAGGPCIGRIEGGLKALPGVLDARLNFANRRLAVDWRDGDLDAGRVIAELARIGYRAHPFRPERAELQEARHPPSLMRRLPVA